MSEAKTWTEAQSYCREKYTDLATVGNAEEMKKLKDTVSAAGHRSQVWIGLYSHVDWKWSDGFNQSGAEGRNWEPGEPIYRKANQFCVGMNREGKWFDYSCHEQLPFVCYNGNVVLYIDLYDTTSCLRYDFEIHCVISTIPLLSQTQLQEDITLCQ